MIKKILMASLSLLLSLQLPFCEAKLLESEKVTLSLKELEDEELTYIDHDTFQYFIDNNRDFVLLLAQNGCSHCSSFKPLLAQFANETNTKIYVLNTLALDILDYDHTPCLVFYKEGELINKIDPTEKKDIFEDYEKLYEYMFNYVAILEG